jgi:hypothetical protein
MSARTAVDVCEKVVAVVKVTGVKSLWDASQIHQRDNLRLTGWKFVKRRYDRH